MSGAEANLEMDSRFHACPSTPSQTTAELGAGFRFDCLGRPNCRTHLGIYTVNDIRRNVHIVLCHPEDPRNVGGAIRAAANAGLAGVRVASRDAFDERDLFCYSSGALVKPRGVFDSVPDAVADCHRVIGTSRRLETPTPLQSGLHRD